MPFPFTLPCGLYEALEEKFSENFRMTARILAPSLANFFCQYADRQHKFIIYAMRQRTGAGKLTTCYRKKQIDQFLTRLSCYIQ